MSLTNLTTGARVAPALPPALRLAPYTSPSPISTGPSPGISRGGPRPLDFDSLLGTVPGGRATRNGVGVGPAPDHTVGLRRWTAQLPTASEVAAVRHRAEAAGYTAIAADTGFTVRDPWELAVRFEVAS
jgi:hypothetical protein